MKASKGQAAMEFMLTYGWAILVVLAAIGALAYFGVLSPDKFLPERCLFPSGIDCVDKAVIDTADDGVIQVALRNNIGYTMEVQSTITGTDDCTSPTTLTVNGAAAPVNITNNGQMVVTFDCGADIAEGRFKTDITLSYRNTETGLTHQATGSIRGKAN